MTGLVDVKQGGTQGGSQGGGQTPTPTQPQVPIEPQNPTPNPAPNPNPPTTPGPSQDSKDIEIRLLREQLATVQSTITRLTNANNKLSLSIQDWERERK